MKRMWRTRTRLLLWSGLQGAIVIAAGFALGVRADVLSRLDDAPFVAEVFLFVAIGLVSAALALLAAVPDRAPVSAAALGGLAFAGAALALGYGSEPALEASVRHFVTMGWPCAARTVALAAIPWFALMLAVDRGATLVPGLAGLLAGVASFFFAAASLRMACPLDSRAHLLVWHLGPVVIGAGASLVVGLFWLSRWRRAR